MENYLTLFNSVTGNYHSLPFNDQEIEKIKTTPFYQMDQTVLVKYIYNGLIQMDEPLIFTAGVSYLLKSQTYHLGSLSGANSYYIYVSRGNGDGFCRLCGALSNIPDLVKHAETAPIMIANTIELYGIESPNTNRGSNFTSPKKKRK
jgi:hypothetical protein